MTGTAMLVDVTRESLTAPAAGRYLRGMAPTVEHVELPLQLLAVTTPKGVRRHLFDLEGNKLFSLCGRRLGINPRHLYLGTWVLNVSSSDNANCPTCLRLARAMEDR